MKKLLSILLLWSACVCMSLAQEKQLTVSVLTDSVQQLVEQGRYWEASKLMDATQISSRWPREEKLAFTLVKAIVNFEMEDYQQAFKHLEQLSDNKVLLSDTDYLKTLNYFGRTLTYLEKYEQADSILEVALQLVPDTTAFPSLYAETINSYAFNQENEIATPFYLKSKKLLEQNNQSNTLQYFETLKLLADNYLWLDDSVNFLKVMRQCLASMRKNGFRQHVIYGHCLELLGYHHFYQEQFHAAIENFSQAERIYTKSYGQNHKRTNEVINNIAVSAVKIQDYPKAEKNYLKAIEIQNSKGRNRIAYAEVLNNLADLYFTTGRYDQAIELTKEVLAIFENPQNTFQKNVFYALAHLNMANSYEAQEAYSEALVYLDRADSLLTKLEQWSYLITVKSKKGTVNRYQENFELSKNYYLESLTISKKAANSKASTPSTYANLAANFFYQKEYIPALHYCMIAKKRCRKIYGEHSLIYTKILNQLGRIFEAMESYSMAKKYYRLSARKLIHLLQSYYPILSEQERIQFLNETEELVYAFYGFALKNRVAIPELATDVQRLELVLNTLNTEVTQQILQTKADKDNSLYDDWQQTRRLYRRSFDWSTEQKKRKKINTDSLSKRIVLLEKQIGWKTNAIKNTSYTYLDVQRPLKTEEAVIDFLQFRFGDYGLKQADSVQYAAIITLPHKELPILVPLCSGSALASILNLEVGPTTNNYINNKALNHQLYELIWQPLEQYLTNTTTVHLAPSGLLHKVSFASLHRRSSKFPLIHQFEIAYYASLKNFIERARGKSKSREIALFGGARYDYVSSADTSSVVDEKGELEMAEKKKVTPKDRGAMNFDYLPGTKKEVESISAIFRQQNWKVQLYTDKAADEHNFRKLSQNQSVSIIHLATHGFYLNKLNVAKEIATKNLRENILVTDNPLFRAGLVFTGANRSWVNGEIEGNQENGILTAFEIYSMDLSQTNLVVLSACDTGRGEIEAEEGIYGLQRAFKLAGVDTLLVSLWKVPDEATAILMEQFYRNLLEKKQSILTAFTEAQRTVMAENPNRSPYDWGSFVVLN
ncbi:MAG: CHAT domain-containing tetratricopeptide repeat protein [Bacteroidota bacterium]